MFDRYEIGKLPSHINVTQTITEHKAPTDQSIKLLKEMEEAALNKVIIAYTFGNNGLEFPKGSAIIFQTAIGYKCSFVFKINGKEIKSSVDIPDNGIHETDRNTWVINTFVDVLAKEISTQITLHMIREHGEPDLAKIAKIHSRKI